MVLTLEYIFPSDNTPIICDFGAATREGGKMEYYTIGYQSTLYPGRLLLLFDHYMNANYIDKYSIELLGIIYVVKTFH